MRLVVVTGALHSAGAQQFIDDVWKGGEVYLDASEAFKHMLHPGGGTYSALAILRPSVIRHVVRYAKRFGHGESDIKDKGNQMLGGTVVVEGGKTIYQFRETKKFENGSAQAVLDAVRNR